MRTDAGHSRSIQRVFPGRTRLPESIEHGTVEKVSDFSSPESSGLTLFVARCVCGAAHFAVGKFSGESNKIVINLLAVRS